MDHSALEKGSTFGRARCGRTFRCERGHAWRELSLPSQRDSALIAMDVAAARGLLRVPVGATKAQLQAAFRDAALRFHPDRPNGDATRFKQAQDALALLELHVTGAGRRCGGGGAGGSSAYEHPYRGSSGAGSTSAEYRSKYQQQRRQERGQEQAYWRRRQEQARRAYGEHRYAQAREQGFGGSGSQNYGSSFAGVFGMAVTVGLAVVLSAPLDDINARKAAAVRSRRQRAAGGKDEEPAAAAAEPRKGARTPMRGHVRRVTERAVLGMSRGAGSSSSRGGAVGRSSTNAGDLQRHSDAQDAKRAGAGTGAAAAAAAGAAPAASAQRKSRADRDTVAQNAAARQRAQREQAPLRSRREEQAARLAAADAAAGLGPRKGKSYGVGVGRGNRQPRASKSSKAKLQGYVSRSSNGRVLPPQGMGQSGQRSGPQKVAKASPYNENNRHNSAPGRENYGEKQAMQGAGGAQM